MPAEDTSMTWPPVDEVSTRAMIANRLPAAFDRPRDISARSPATNELSVLSPPNSSTMTCVAFGSLTVNGLTLGAIGMVPRSRALGAS